MLTILVATPFHTALVLFSFVFLLLGSVLIVQSTWLVFHLNNTISCAIADQVAHQMIWSYCKWRIRDGLQTNIQAQILRLCCADRIQIYVRLV